MESDLDTLIDSSGQLLSSILSGSGGPRRNKKSRRRDEPIPHNRQQTPPANFGMAALEELVHHTVEETSCEPQYQSLDEAFRAMSRVRIILVFFGNNFL